MGPSSMLRDTTSAKRVTFEEYAPPLPGQINYLHRTPNLFRKVPLANIPKPNPNSRPPAKVNHVSHVLDES